MVKLNKLFVLLGLTTLSAYVAKASDFEGECGKFADSIDSKKIQIKNCEIDENDKIYSL